MGRNVWQMDCIALCAGVPQIIYQPPQIIFQVRERKTAKQSAEPRLRPSRLTAEPLGKWAEGSLGAGSEQRNENLTAVWVSDRVNSIVKEKKRGCQNWWQKD